MARLTSFSLRNFRSYRDATLHLAPVTLLVGANASGKSNLIEAMQMLAWLGRGQRLEDVFRAVQDAELSIRGQPAQLAREGEAGFSLACNIRKGRWRDLVVSIKHNGDGLRIHDESITGSGTKVPLYEVKKRRAGGHDLSIAYNNFAAGRNKPEVSCTSEQAVFTQLLTPARFSASHVKSQTEIPQTCRAFIDSLQSIMFLDPVPQRMRSPSFADDKRLRSDSRNLSSTLFDLVREQARKELILEFIKDLPEQHITDIDFLVGPRNDVLVRLKETFGGEAHWRDASILSDGTLRVLAIAGALLSVQEFSTVVLEEIDNGIHPSRAQQLMKGMRKLAIERRLAVLITTHNPALLDALPVEAIPDVVFCYRDPKEGDSNLVRLQDLPSYPELVARGPLGRLVTQGIVDHMVKAATSRQDRKQANLRYLEELSRLQA